ncbi:MAG: hypothetical protein HRT35_24110, partial [Algicola sp.]|nr:hypothetical protein [Algicola sp.]
MTTSNNQIVLATATANATGLVFTTPTDSQTFKQSPPTTLPTFCLRQIQLTYSGDAQVAIKVSPKQDAKNNAINEGVKLPSFDTSILTPMELKSIMTPVGSDVDVLDGGCDLAFMPLFIPEYTSITGTGDTAGEPRGTKSGFNAVQTLVALGMPLGMTVWLDERSVVNMTKDAAVRSNFKTAWIAAVNQAGYSVGTYNGNLTLDKSLDGASADLNFDLTLSSGGSVLSMPLSLPQGGCKPVSIGENAGVNTIQWACITLT